MRRPKLIEQEIEQISTVEDLTDVFESIASTQVAKVKSKVELSKDFFNLLWQRYIAIRIDPKSRITQQKKEDNGKKAFVIISGAAGLSGDIDDRLIETMLHDYDDAATTDILVVGSHGAAQLDQRGIPYIRYFKVPETETYIDVSPVIAAISDYAKIKVYYEEYISLGVQQIKTIDLHSSIQTMSEEAGADEDIITAEDAIFEPSLEEIASSMEMTMMTLAFSQTILESSLAQNASRFNAMAVAKKRALELILDHTMEFHRAKRAQSDRRLREVMISLKKKKHAKEKR
jgi:F-type H+-transporting ATPase subunit gamma